jgi:hypothetical protein
MSESNVKKGNWFMRHKVITGILVVIVLIMVLGSSGGNKSSTTSSGGSESKQEQAKVSAKIGEVAQSSDLAFTVTGVKDYQSLGNSYTRKDPQGVFKVISLKIENTGKETKTIDSSMIKLRDSQGRTFERSIDGQTAKGLAQGQVDLFLQQVQPSLSVNGEIVFDIPKDAEGLVLEVRGGLFATATDINLEQ